MPTFNEKMTALADVIRTKTGLVGKLTIDQMVTAVSSLSGGVSPVEVGGLPDGDLTTYDVRVTVSGSAYNDQNILYTGNNSDGTGAAYYIQWFDINWESFLWLVYAPEQDGTGSAGIEYATNHKWTLYQSGDVIFYCDDTDPTTGQWYNYNGTAFNGVTIEFQAK